MKKEKWLVVVVIALMLALLCAFAVTEGYFEQLKNAFMTEASDSNEVHDDDNDDDNDNDDDDDDDDDGADTALEQTVTVGKIDGRNVLLGDEDVVIDYVMQMNQQEWLDFALVEDEVENYEYYGRVKEDEVIVVSQDDTIVSAGEVELCKELYVRRAGNAFLVEDELGQVTKSHGKTSYRNNEQVEIVDTMSDKGIYKTAYCEEDQAIYESATLDKVFPDAINVEGTLKIKNGFNPDLLKALVLVRYQVIDVDGNEVTVYAIEWNICACNESVVSNTGNNNNGGGSDSSEKDPTPTATPAPVPTATPKAPEEHEPDKTAKPTPVPTATPKVPEAHEPDRTVKPTPVPTATPKVPEAHEPDRTVAPVKPTPTPDHATARPTKDTSKEYPDAPVTGGEVSKDDDVFVKNTVKEYEDAPVTSGTVSSDVDVFASNEEYSTERKNVSAEKASSDRSVGTKSTEGNSSDRVATTKASEVTSGVVSTDEDPFDN